MKVNNASLSTSSDFDKLHCFVLIKTFRLGVILDEQWSNVVTVLVFLFYFMAFIIPRCQNTHIHYFALF